MRPRRMHRNFFRRHRFPLRRGIGLLPGLLTLGNLSLGMMALLNILHGRLERAAWMVVVAIVLDSLDGWVARTTRTASALGLQLDSLADLVSFGVVPAILLYRWTGAAAAVPVARSFAVAMVLFYTACTALRLARFNVIAPTADPRFFVGLPSPGAAALGVTTTLAFPRPSPGSPLLLGPLVLMGILAVLMVSRLRYRSFKRLEAYRRWPLATLATVALLLALALSYPHWTLWAGSVAYVLSGPVARLSGSLRRAPARYRVEPP
jgi:CDP-diacylglycerol--serine O-phosphatidyltransferase